MAHKVDVSKPTEFNGNWSAKEVDNFIWSMKQYFGIIGIQDKMAKVRNISMFLTKNVLFWWQNMCDETKRGVDPINV